MLTTPPNKSHIRYLNHRGDNAWRWIAPIRIYFGSTEYHPEEQFLMEAYDFERKAVRHFAMRGILEVKHMPFDFRALTVQIPNQ